MLFKGPQLLQNVKNLAGDTIQRRDDAGAPKTTLKGEPVLLQVKDVIREGLTATLQTIPEDDKQKRECYRLARQIMQVPAEGEIELDTDQIVLIKKKIFGSWGIEVACFVEEILEGKNKDFAVISGGQSGESN